MTTAKRLLGALSRLFAPPPTRSVAHPGPRTRRRDVPPTDSTATIEISPPRAEEVRIAYAPNRDGDPDAGEVVWTWVPYAENDGRGKDRPVLVVARLDGEHLLAVRLTSKSHDGDRDFLSIGSGDWDPQGRPSWVVIDQVYSVHAEGMRREGSALDVLRFRRVAEALHRRYGWPIAF